MEAPGHVPSVPSPKSSTDCTTFCTDDIAAHYPGLIEKPVGSSKRLEFNRGGGFDYNKNPDLYS